MKSKIQHAKLANNPNKVILFHGDMGAGKTTFIKQLAELGVMEAVAQPFL
jgi:tRNA threonylcarbamoyladenosine biosynthesis protein TsaE